MGNWRKILIVILGLVAGILLWIGWQWASFVNQPFFYFGKSTSVILLPGQTVKNFAEQLKTKSLLKQPEFLIWLVRLSGSSHFLKAGEYQIEAGLTPWQLLRRMIKGEAIHHLVTIVPGWSFPELCRALATNPFLEHQTLNLSAGEIMRAIGHDGEVPEGRFAPDTYFFSGKVPDLFVLKKAYNLMAKNLNEAFIQRDFKVNYHCPYEALIVASLIEKETALNSEKAKIAGVILKRLAMGMPLQIDASVLYGIDSEYKAKLKSGDFKIDTPYNTYLHRGLPIGAICMPSRSSIMAALRPEIGDDIYYVARGDGGHVFSKTFEEHVKAVEQYQKRGFFK
jgi:UPF0755 protein